MVQVDLAMLYNHHTVSHRAKDKIISNCHGSVTRSGHVTIIIIAPYYHVDSFTIVECSLFCQGEGEVNRLLTVPD